MLDGQQGSGIRNARWADPDVYSVKYAFQEGDIWIGRNPHDANYPIGHRDDKHIMVCAGASSGKGRSFIVNNLALWQGSTITYDPKGELPDILAPRRGEGDEYCDGMGQDVFVLDPFNRSTVDDRYRGYCDPISMIDPDDSELSNTCYRLANSLVKKKESGQAQDWADKGIAFTALVVEHVVTYREFRPEERNLHTVYELVLQGNVAQADAATEAFAAFAAERNANLADGEQPVKPKVFDPYEVLLNDMIGNERASRFLGMEARALMREMERVPKYFTHVSGEAREGLRWLRSSGIERVLSGKGLDESRCFDPRRLKTDPNGVSLFIVLPIEDLKENEPWLQSLFVGIFAAIRAQKIKPKVPILTVLDEFSSLGYQDYIASSLDNIRGAGMKIAFIVQNFGKLKKLYGDEMESFFTNSGLELYFGKIGQIASEYLRKELGETEVVRLARNVNRSENENESEGESIAFGTSSSSGGSTTKSDTSGESISKSSSFGWSKGTNWSDSENWGQTDGTSMGRNYGPHVFFEGLEHSNNYGSNLSRNSGRGTTRGGNHSKSGQKSESKSTNTSQTLAQGSTWNTTTSKTKTKNVNRSRGYQIGGGIAETFHAKPLLEPHEITGYLAALPESEHDHPAYPGMVLVRIHGEDPFFVRRSNYDQDPYFLRAFSNDPLHAFLPIDQQPLLAFEYTKDHIVELQTPIILRNDELYLEAARKAGERFEAGEIIAYLQPLTPLEGEEDEFDEDGERMRIADFHAQYSGRIVEVYDEETQRASSCMRLRAHIPLSPEQQREIELHELASDVSFSEQRRNQSIEWKKELLIDIRKGKKEADIFWSNFDAEYKPRLDELSNINQKGLLLRIVYRLVHKFRFTEEEQKFMRRVNKARVALIEEYGERDHFKKLLDQHENELKEMQKR